MHKKSETSRKEEVVAQAIHRYARVSARKLRLVADMIRDKPVGEAMRILTFTVKPSAVPIITNVLKSAIANVPEGQVDNPDSDLRVGEVFVDGAYMMKRFRAAPMGRAVPIRKRAAHVTLRLTRV
jgi:large subunit ribosomal protein L22